MFLRDSRILKSRGRLILRTVNVRSNLCNGRYIQTHCTPLIDDAALAVDFLSRIGISGRCAWCFELSRRVVDSGVVGLRGIYEWERCGAHAFVRCLRLMELVSVCLFSCASRNSRGIQSAFLTFPRQLNSLQCVKASQEIVSCCSNLIDNS